MLELERYIMIQLGIRKGLLHRDTVEQSQRLDEEILRHMKGER